MANVSIYVSQPISCPGLFCGFDVSNDTVSNTTLCGPCPRGSRVFPNHRAALGTLCEPCSTPLSLHDWMFLGFSAFLGPVLSLYYITRHQKSPGPATLQALLYVSVIGGCLISALISLLIYPPIGLLRLNHCPVYQLADWYPYLFNPRPDFVTTIHCSHEVVYPLHTIVLVYYAFCTLFHLFVQPLIIFLVVKNSAWVTPLYYSLYTFPVLVIVHVIFGGLLYYSYPYIVLIVSVIKSADTLVQLFPLATTEKEVLVASIRQPYNLMTILVYWLIHFYGIVALTELEEASVYGPLMCIIPLPYLFFIFSIRFTDSRNVIDQTQLI